MTHLEALARGTAIGMDWIFEACKPEAKMFKRWVKHEVLPSILKLYESERREIV